MTICGHICLRPKGCLVQSVGFHFAEINFFSLICDINCLVKLLEWNGIGLNEVNSTSFKQANEGIWSISDIKIDPYKVNPTIKTEQLHTCIFTVHGGSLISRIFTGSLIEMVQHWNNLSYSLNKLWYSEGLTSCTCSCLWHSQSYNHRIWLPVIPGDLVTSLSF